MRFSLARALSAAVLVALLAPTPLAQTTEGSGPEEVFLADLVFPQEQGEIQVTLAPVLGEAGSHRSLQSALVFEAGLTDAWQIEAGWATQPFALDVEHAFELGTQYSWIDIAGAGLHAALGIEGEWEGSAFEGTTPYAILAADLGTVHAFTQSFVTLASDTDDELADAPDVDDGEGDWGAIVGAVLPVGPAFATAELGWSHAEFGSRYSVTPGVVAPLADGWQVGLALPVSRLGDATTVGLAAYLTFEFELGDDN